MKESQIQRHAEKINRKVKLKKRKKKILIATLSGMAAAAVVAVNLVLFVPFTAGGYDISQYKNSEYYSLMEKIEEVSYRHYKTNHYIEWGLDKNGGDLVFNPENNAADWEQSSSGGSSPVESYVEVTNNQVEGIIEGDLLKRTSEYAYYISEKSRWSRDPETDEFIDSGYYLSIYTVSRGELVSKYLIVAAEGEQFVFDSHTEMFLSDDLKTLTLFTMCQKIQDSKYYTEAISVDVSNPEAPEVKHRYYVSGIYNSARLIGGNFLLATNFHFLHPNFKNEKDYLPQSGGQIDALESFPIEDIHVPEKCNESAYSILVKLDQEMNVLSSAALFSYSSETYVSNEHLFLARETREWFTDAKTGMVGVSETNTGIACYSYKDELKFEGEIEAKGTIVDQYSLDEYQNTLRVVTTFYCMDEERPWHPECNLYVFSLDSFEETASILDFSDPDESVKSVRFDGEKAYVCTAKVETKLQPNHNLYEAICDPVFEFDLSDLQNITWKDTGEISGFSMSLSKFKDGTLVGVGYGETFDQFKVEVYRAEGSAVTPIARYEMEIGKISKKYKSYFIDAERGLVGFAYKYYSESEREDYISYVLLKFDGEKIELVNEIPIPVKDSRDTNLIPDLCRACLIDEKLYVFAPDFFKIIAL